MNNLFTKKRTWTISLGLLVTMGAFFFTSESVYAHPHIFIAQRLTIQFNDKGLSGIKVFWEFDEMFAAMIAQDFDQNHNGHLEATEVAVIKEKAFSYISDSDYFTFIKIDNKVFKVKFITDFNAVMQKKTVVYEFTIPCHVTAIGTPKKIKVASYDPSYYSAIFFSENTPVSLSGHEPFSVKTEIKEDPDTKIYYDMVHPWTLFLEFNTKP